MWCCSGAGGGGGEGGSSGGSGGGAVNVLMVNNPQMVDLQKLTADNFTKATGIKVNYTVVPENDVRDKISQEFSAQAGQYDVASLSNFEIPIYAKNGWVADLTEKANGDAAFNQGDIMKSMSESLSYEGKIYGEPFYGESSFTMYRKDLFEAKGLTMPDKPTWDEIADLAAKLDDGQYQGHLPARYAGLGRRQLLCGPGQGARRGRRTAGRFHRVPEQHHAGQDGDVVRRNLGRGLPGICGQPQQGQVRLCRGTGQGNRQLRLALHLGLGGPEGLEEPGQRREVHRVGLECGRRLVVEARALQPGVRHVDEDLLQSRPMDVVEAARIDGASSWQIFTNMTPHLRQYMELAGLLGTIYVVQNFDHVFTITSGGLGTANLPNYIYQTFYTGQDYGLASAAGVVVVVLTIIVSTIALRTVFSIFREDQR